MIFEVIDMKRNRALIFATLLLVISPLAYCGLFGDDGDFSGPEIRGTVTDMTTGKPVEGAIVIWRWEGRHSVSIADSQHICYRVDLATTDDNGRYLFPAWEVHNKDIPDIQGKFDVVRGVYKNGYQWWGTMPHSATALKVKSINNDDEYLKSLQQTNNAPVCGLTYLNFTDEKRKQFMHLFEFLVEDAMHLKGTPERDNLIAFSQRQIKYFRDLQIKDKEAK